MKWEKPHPSNAEAAKRCLDAVMGAEGIILTAIADRLAGVEEALTVIALNEREWNDECAVAQSELARRVEAEAQTPAPRRST